MQRSPKVTLPALLSASIVPALVLLASVNLSACNSEAEFAGGQKLSSLQQLSAQDSGRLLNLRNLPANPSSDTALNVTVESMVFTQYQYALVEGDATCADVKFSPSISLSVPITDTLGADGKKRLCARGTLEGFQPQETVTEYSWVKDTVAPGPFSIEDLASVMKEPLASLAWSASVGADSYDFVASTDALCGLPVHQQTFTTTSAAFKPLSDGSYFICVAAADDAGNRTPADNNGLAVRIDTTPPLPFSINRPLSPTRQNPPEVAWTSSKVELDTSYDVTVASDQACQTIVEQRQAVAGAAVQLNTLLEDGSTYYVCVTASDEAGHSTAASNQGYEFRIDQTGLTIAFVESTLPKDPDVADKLAVAVEAAELHQYRYKIGAAAATDCAKIDDYSTPRGAAELILDEVGDLPAGRYAICAIGSDLAGNWDGDGTGTAYARFEWGRDVTPPAITLNALAFCGPQTCPDARPEITGAAADADGNIAKVMVSIENKSSGKCLSASNQFTSSCPLWVEAAFSAPNYSFNVPNASMATGRVYEITAVAHDAAGRMSAAVTKQYVWDSTVPVVNQILAAPVRPANQANSNAFSSRVNFMKMTMKATDGESPVKALCYTYNTALVPAANASCWRDVGGPLVSGTPAKSIDLTNISYTIGFVPGIYLVRGWVKDAAGNISNASTSTVSIDYNPVRPPLLSHMYVTNSATEPLPETANTVLNATNRTVYIRWAVSTNNPAGLASKPISIFYTTDDKTFIEVEKDVNANNAPAGVCTKPTAYSGALVGCVKWTVPSSIGSGYVRFRIQATDIDGAISYGRTNALNLSNFVFLAGNTEDGIGGTARGAILTPKSTQSLVVHPSGKIFLLDARGLLFVDTFDGTLKTYIAIGNGIVNPRSIALGAGNKLIVFDTDRILEIDVSSDAPQVTTIAGGGAAVSDVVAVATDLKISNGSAFMAVGPNGDIYFESEPASTVGQYRLRRYVQANKSIESIKFSGSKILFHKIFATKGYTAANTPIQNISACGTSRFMVNFDQATGAANEIVLRIRTASNLPDGSCWVPYVNATEPSDYLAFKKSGNSWALDVNKNFSYMAVHGGQVGVRETSYINYIQGVDGRIYATANGVGAGNDKVYRYDYGNAAWDELGGHTNGGECADGEMVATCAMAVDGGFADGEGRLYVMDNNTVRVIQADGRVQTVAGESRSAGDTRDPLSARFNEIASLGLWKNGQGDFRFVVADKKTYTIREFGEGTTIDLVAGNRIDLVTSDLDKSAKNNSLTWGNDAASANIQVDRTNGDIYTLKIQGHFPYKIERASGKWRKLGDTINTGGGYGPHVVAMSGAKVLFGTFNYYSDVNQVANGRLFQINRTYSPTNAAENVLMKSDWNAPGKRYDFSNFPVCAAGVSRMDCNGPRSGSGAQAEGYFDVPTNSWILSVPGPKNPVTNVITSRIVSIPVTANAGNDRLVDLHTAEGGAISAFAMKKTTNSTKLFYCQAGKVYSVALGASTPALMPFPVAGMACPSQGSMIYDSQRDSLIFNYTFNGLQGVAEFLNP